MTSLFSEEPTLPFTRRLKVKLARFITAIGFASPFPSVFPNIYTRLSFEPNFDKLDASQVELFKNQVIRFIVDTRLPDTHYTIFEAMSKQIGHLDPPSVAVDLEDGSEIQHVERRRMLEVLVRSSGVYIAMFEAVKSKPRKMSHHHRVQNWRDGSNRRLRFLENADGELVEGTFADKSFNFDPQCPLMACRIDVTEDHPLYRWIPQSQSSESPHE